MFDHVLRELYPRPLQIGPRGLRTARVSACLLASALDLWWGAGGQYIRHIPHLLSWRPGGQAMPDADPRCPTCPFWDEGARRRKAESAEHHDWRPCTHPKPDTITGPQELLTRTGKLLTSPATTCRSHPARGRA